jgi:hypothetical protein
LAPTHRRHLHPPRRPRSPRPHPTLAAAAPISPAGKARRTA